MPDPLTPERWTEVKALFTEAVERSPEARAALLDERCQGDQALREAVERLLEAHGRAGDFIEVSPVIGLTGIITGGRWTDVVRGGYRFGQRIGAGGMGEVYEAWHIPTETRTAVKVLAAESDGAASRLRREARHAAMLDHPGICAVRDVVEDENGAFIAMEFIDGPVLADALPERGFDQAEAVRIATGLADAIAHAHDRGVVHRDLKTANVMLTREGRVKVLDFGLARLLPGSIEAEVSAVTLTTETGVVAGTLSYLAPEVLRGERADARSDVWAFGVVLHELLTGQMPFQGRTPFALTSSVLSAGPEPLPAGLPASLVAIRDNCLVKDPALRYRNGSEIREALRVFQAGGRVANRSARRAGGGRRAAALGGLLTVLAGAIAGVWAWATSAGPPEVTTTSVVVMPLAGGDDAGDQYFVEGMTDAITTRLGTIEALRVIARTSAQQFMNETDPAVIARALRVDAVVRGSVARSGNRVVLSAELLDVSSGRRRWHDTFEREASEVLALEGDAVRALADALGVPVTPAAATRLATIRAVAPAVHEDYLKGRFHWNRRTTESISEAMRHFESAIARDPTYAPAHAALADCYNQLATYMVGAGSPAEYRPRARAAAIAAIQADDTLAEAHATLGYVSHYDWDWTTAEREFRRALALNPNLALAYIWYANYLVTRGRADEAVAAARRAEELDPFSRVVVTNVGWTYSLARRPEDAIAAFERALKLDPDYLQARMRLAGELNSLGRHAEAIELADGVVQSAGRTPSNLFFLGTILAGAGRRAEVEHLLAELVDMARSRYVSPVGFYHLYFMLGDADRGFAWLDKAVSERTNSIVYLNHERPLDTYRDDPRYRRIVQMVGLPDAR